MYTISKGPSKIVQKTRRGLTQNLESLEALQDLAISVRKREAAAADPTGLGGGKASAGLQAADDMSKQPRSPNSRGTQGEANVAGGNGAQKGSPQYPVFTVSQYSRRERSYHRSSQEKVSPQQEAILKYVNDKWSTVQKEIELAKSNGKSNVTYYQDLEPNPSLRNFEPFDLESWWGRKLYRNLTQQQGP